jgi:hypothetical protein
MTSSRLSPVARLDFAAYVGQLAVPAVVMGVAASAVVTGRRRSLVAIVAGYLGISAFVGWDSLRWERTPAGAALETGERLRRSLRVSLFNGLWLLVVPRALVDLAFRHGPMRYVKMEHGGAGEPAGAAIGPRPAE